VVFVLVLVGLTKIYFTSSHQIPSPPRHSPLPNPICWAAPHSATRPHGALPPPPRSTVPAALSHLRRVMPVRPRQGAPTAAATSTNTPVLYHRRPIPQLAPSAQSVVGDERGWIQFLPPGVCRRQHVGVEPTGEWPRRRSPFVRWSCDGHTEGNNDPFQPKSSTCILK
jgi:hypothetical protein